MPIPTSRGAGARRARFASSPVRAIAAVSLAAFSFAAAASARELVDDAGHRFAFGRPPARIVTLAPSLTELVFAAGGGKTLVGVSALSDFPAEAKRIARIGDAGRVDVERVLALKPDLVLVWQRGNLSRELEQLERAGVLLFQLAPQRLDDVARAIERLGALLGHDAEATRRAAALRATLDRLRREHAGVAPVAVFYQVWQQPLMTINGRQIVNDMLELCGGSNVFARLAPLVPIVSTEAVVGADPEAILTANEHGAAPAWQRDPANPSFALWRRHPKMRAVAHGRLYSLNGDFVSRQGPRVGEGAAAVCAVLDDVRRERSAR
jgi:iron complex transport system substrate-binding protein